MPFIVGITNPTSFTGKDGTLVEGSSFYISEPLDSRYGEGIKVEKVFMTKARLANLDFTPRVNQEVTVLFNRHGKVETLKLVHDDLLDD